MGTFWKVPHLNLEGVVSEEVGTECNERIIVSWEKLCCIFFTVFMSVDLGFVRWCKATEKPSSEVVRPLTA